MAKIVFILGAGASDHAEVPLMKNFYDKAINLIEENKIDQEDKKYFEMIRDFYQEKIRQISANFDFDLKNIETIFSLIDIAKLTKKFKNFTYEQISELSTAINKFIVRTIEKTTKIHINRDANIISPHDYGVFVNELLRELIDPNSRSAKDCCIISFNYDLALDYVMELFNGPSCINYYLSQQKIYKTFKLLKLHGSINWATCSNKNCDNIQSINIRDNFIALGNTPLYIEMSKKIKKMNCEKCKEKLNDLPLIIPPTWNKPGNYNIENVWHQAAKELSDAKNIFIIGYSLPKTDLFFQYLLALGTLDITNLERFWVFDRDPKIEEKYNDLLRVDIKEKFMFKEMDFNEAINEIKNVLFNSPEIAWI
jgi:hypothetical protein